MSDTTVEQSVQFTEQVTETAPSKAESFADEAIPPAKVTGESDPRFYTQEDIEAARKQEKDKLYRRLETMQEQVARLEQEQRQRQEQAEAEQRALEEEARKQAESEMSAKELLELKEREWQEKMRGIEQQMEAERALRERETQFAELMNIRQQLINDYSDRVAPELIDLIEGENADELRQSAEDMAARTQRILAQTQEAMQNVRQQTPTARITAPMSGENSGTNARVMSPEEIRSMSMADYAKQRRSLLGEGADGPTNRGLFG